MPTLNGGSLWWFAAWNLAGLAGALLANSFAEWTIHRFVMHRRTILSYAYRKHAQTHHVLFDGGEFYHARDEYMKAHITFTALDYVLILLACLPFWVGLELLVQRPIVAGCLLATLAGLQLFNSLHLRFHVPSDTWLQRTRLFLLAKEHHRRHHEDPACNLNVATLPIADWLFGTLRRLEPGAAR
jgi:hypothetical protein